MSSTARRVTLSDDSQRHSDGHEGHLGRNDHGKLLNPSYASPRPVEEPSHARIGSSDCRHLPASALAVAEEDRFTDDGCCLCQLGRGKPPRDVRTRRASKQQHGRPSRPHSMTVPPRDSNRQRLKPGRTVTGPGAQALRGRSRRLVCRKALAATTATHFLRIVSTGHASGCHALE